MDNIMSDLSNSPEIFLRGVFSVLILFFFTKLMGKKQLSQLNFFDYCVGISIGSIAAEMAASTDTSYIHAVISMGVYTLISVGITYLSIKHIKARKFFIGTPSILIYNGSLLKKSIKKSKITVNDLLEECRLHGYFDISSIEYAIMESNGKISFMLKENQSPITPKDLNLQSDKTALLCNIVIDGRLIHKNIEGSDLKVEDVLNEIRSKNLNKNDILLCTYNSKEKTYTYYLANENLIPHNFFD